MTQIFTLEGIADGNFCLETNAWTGKTKLSYNNEPLQKLSEKGKPFAFKDKNENVSKIFIGKNIDFSTSVTVNGKKFQIDQKLKWYEYVYGAVPILLLFVGGAVGGGLGAGATVINFYIIRTEKNLAVRLIKIAGVSIAAYLLYLLVAFLITLVFK